MERRDVVIVGGGPAGLAAARRLADLGVKSLTVLERETQAGGIPRHCGHWGFGWQSHLRIWKGPDFAAALRQSVADLDVRTGTTVLRILPDRRLLIRNASGVAEIEAREIIIATGTRETPRSARLVGGSRPQGVMNTGALQQHVYLANFKPFERPVIVGTEWVSFSAILTCHHMGIRPVAMLEEEASIEAPWPGALVAKHVYGVPVMTNTKLLAIEGRGKVEAVEVEQNGERRRIACDGVILTGKFVPENSILVQGPHIHTAGNINAPLKTSGLCWREGRAMAETIARKVA